jgi:hypothetical protein
MKRVSKKLVSQSVVILFFAATFLLSSGFKCNDKYLEKDRFCFNDDCKDIIEGLYILNSCENGRFKINLKKNGSLYAFSILDGKKIISRGKASIRKEDGETIITMDKIAGLFEKNNITIQNYGNSMNEYIHFTQCGEKYLSFEKK